MADLEADAIVVASCRAASVADTHLDPDVEIWKEVTKIEEKCHPHTRARERGSKPKDRIPHNGMNHVGLAIP